MDTSPIAPPPSATIAVEIPQDFSNTSEKGIRKHRFGDVYSIVVGFVGVIAAGTIIYESLLQSLSSDFKAEISFTAHGLHTGVFPGNFLFYWLNALFAGFQTSQFWLRVGLTAALAIATGMKMAMSARFALTEDARTVGSSSSGAQAGAIAVLAGLCAFTFSWPGASDYLGQIPANVWHNATTILMMPFAVGLFWTALLYLRTPAKRYLWWALLLGVLNVAAKPSFITCFIPVFPIAALLRYKFSKETFRAWCLTTGLVFILGIQYVYVYVIDPKGSRLGTSSSVVFAPFKVWNLFLSYHAGPGGAAAGFSTPTGHPAGIGLAILRSYSFPIVALIFGGTAIRRNLGVQLSLGLAFVGLLEYAFLAEAGPSYSSGNYTWAAIATQYILFLSILTAIISIIRTKGWGIRQIIMLLMFFPYVWFGVAYLVRWFATKSFD